MVRLPAQAGTMASAAAIARNIFRISPPQGKQGQSCTSAYFASRCAPSCTQRSPGRFATRIGRDPFGWKCAPPTRIAGARFYRRSTAASLKLEALKIGSGDASRELIENTLLLLLIVAVDQGVVDPLHQTITLLQVILFLVCTVAIRAVAVVAVAHYQSGSIRGKNAAE